MNEPPARIGMSIGEIETPSLVIDLDAYERNLDRMAAAFAGRPVRLRPHAKTHKCPLIAHHQIQRGAVGVCCQKVGEAEVMVRSGINDVLVSNEIVGSTKVRRLAALARQATIGVCVDDADNVAELAAAAKLFGVKLNVLVEVDVGAGRCGVLPGSQSTELARLVCQQPSLRFIGLQAYHGKAQHIYDVAQRRSAIDQAIDLTIQAVDDLRASGIACPVVTGAGTGTFDFEGQSGVFNEIQAGSYIFMDGDYKRVEGPSQSFENALFVLATVMSRPTRDRAILDAGLKAYAVDSGLPVVKNQPDVTCVGASDEHTNLRLDDPASRMCIGDRVWLIPGHCDPTVNLYDWYVGIRDDRVEALWPIAARGAVT